MKRANLRHKSSVALKVFVYFWLCFFAVVALLPLYYLFITAFKSLHEASTQATFFPQSFELFENIRVVFTTPSYTVVRMFLNTMLVFALKTVGTCITCSVAAWGFARFKFPFKNYIFFVLLSALMIPGELLGIPIFEFMVNTGLRDVFYIPLWIGSFFATDIFIIFMFKQFFESIPKELLEAARIDGCKEMGIFIRIVAPLNVPVFTTVTLLYFVGTYNDLYGPALYVTEESRRLMASSINIFETMFKSPGGDYIVPWNYVAVASLVALAPVVIFFAFMQRKFMESVAGAGIKG